jgi:hypothetical protein
VTPSSSLNRLARALLAAASHLAGRLVSGIVPP